MDAIPLPIAILDRDGRLQYGNRAWTETVGGISGLSSSAQWIRACHPDDRSWAATAFRAAVDERKGFTIAVRLKAPNGVWRRWSFTGEPHFRSDGDLDYYVGTCRDVTAEYEAPHFVRRLSAKLIGSQESERSRLARTLHDDLAQRVAVGVARVDTLAELTRSSAKDVKSLVANIRLEFEGIATAVHALSHQLHPATLELLGLRTTLEGLCREVSSAHHVPVTFECEGALLDVTDDVALCLFRVAQEALQNAAKHAAASSILVRASGSATEVRLQVIDDGYGFDPVASMSAGVGVLIMRQRVELVNGVLTIESSRDEGTAIKVIVPVTPHTVAQ
jgi:PAS domain S-box-containing protein